MNDRLRRWSADGANVLRGLCMGCADVVPGVSGGTVALILGIYARLVTAISHCDRILLRRLQRRRWAAAARYLDVRFLAALGLGIVSGVVAMSLLVNRLLNHDLLRSVTLAAFFGMILASAVFVAALIRPASPGQTVRCLALGLAGAGLAWWASTLQAAGGAASDPSYLWLFVCGSIAICAMILPGISGAMMLLVLGVYAHLTDVPHNLLAGEQVLDQLTILAVFGSGCAISLILFSKVLRWLLSAHHAATMSLLCGFMIGALRKLWPFQVDLTPHVDKFKHKQFRLTWPEALDGPTLLALAAALVAMGLVFAADRLVHRRR